MNAQRAPPPPPPPPLPAFAQAAHARRSVAAPLPSPPPPPPPPPPPLPPRQRSGAPVTSTSPVQSAPPTAAASKAVVEPRAREASAEKRKETPKKKKKKVRLQLPPAKEEEDEQQQAKAEEKEEEDDDDDDVFHVTISNVRANLRVVEPRPVVLLFDFDGYWRAGTDVYARDVNPQWRFDTASMRGGGEGEEEAGRARYASDARFVYRARGDHHERWLRVTLAERSACGDVAWASAAVSVEALARGCPAVQLTLRDAASGTIYGLVSFSAPVVNVRRVRVLVTDLTLSDYPPAFAFDQKHLRLHLRHRVGATESARTEPRSDAAPRFAAAPCLELDASLPHLVRSCTLFFEAHRQVARERSDPFAVGAMPLHLLLARAKRARMRAPSKFKVPLAAYKGFIRGKVALRRIPQFAQLTGPDLVNVDGVITPSHVDLAARKLLPWLPLPHPPPQPPPQPPQPPLPPRSPHSALTVTDTLSEPASEPASDPASDPDPYHPPQQDAPEWLAVHHEPTQQFFFVHQRTHESLWLPPDWAHMHDVAGRPYFVDHANCTTQLHFPLEQARAYRESVTASKH